MLSGLYSLFRSRANGLLISSSFTGFFSAARRLVLSINIFTWQSWANASFTHSIHANAFTPFTQMHSLHSRQPWPLRMQHCSSLDCKPPILGPLRADHVCTDKGEPMDCAQADKPEHNSRENIQNQRSTTQSKNYEM